MDEWIQKVGLVASIAMPFFNIPMIFHLIKRKKSDDISLAWILGVWVCSVLMTPQALRSDDPAFKAFGIVNIFFFSAVTFLVLKYRSVPAGNSRGK